MKNRSRFNFDLKKIRSVANYQFARGAGEALFPSNVAMEYSRRTGRIKYVHLRGSLLATLRPTHGTFTLTFKGFRRLMRRFKPPRFRVIVPKDIAPLIKNGTTVFAKNVKNTDINLRSQDEVAVTDERDRLLAIGKTVLGGREMLMFKRGVAVKIRHNVE